MIGGGLWRSFPGEDVCAKEGVARGSQVRPRTGHFGWAVKQSSDRCFNGVEVGFVEMHIIPFSLFSCSVSPFPSPLLVDLLADMATRKLSLCFLGSGLSLSCFSVRGRCFGAKLAGFIHLSPSKPYLGAGTAKRERERERERRGFASGWLTSDVG